MKKLLFGLTAILSVSALAKDYNIYVGGGFNFLDNQYPQAKEKIITKITKGENNNNLEEIKKNISINSDLSLAKFNLKFEVTKEVLEDLELGFGIKYINEIQNETTYNKEASKKFIDKTLNLKNNQVKDIKITMKSISYSSLPIYGTLKYNITNLSDNFTPYIKFDLGYSFNTNVKKLNIKYDVSDKGQNGLNELKERIKDVEKVVENVKAKNGLYFATGIGIEYKNFTAEVLGAYVDGSIDVKDRNNTINRDYSDFKIMTNIGYKF